jgi:hypothetical protein
MYTEDVSADDPLDRQSQPDLDMVLKAVLGHRILPDVNARNPEPKVSKPRNMFQSSGPKFYRIEFHPKRIQICSAAIWPEFSAGTYVITEADRGEDLGKVIGPADKSDATEQKVTHKILRLASEAEVAKLPEKQESEKMAVEICQRIVEKAGLDMEITDAERQFDETQLAFYYYSDRYIDFRSLVHVLFKTFKTRIWMVWHDGKSPVRDVFSRHNRKRQNKKADRNKTNALGCPIE